MQFDIRTHTRRSSIVFARWCQLAHSHLIHPNQHPHYTGAAPWWVASSILTTRHIQASPGLAPFHPQNCPLTSDVWGSGPHLIQGSLGSPKSIAQMASRLVQLFCRAVITDRPTDTLRHSVNRSHLPNGVMQTKMVHVSYRGSVLYHLDDKSCNSFRHRRWLVH